MVASEITIHSAHPTDARRLTAIAHAAKRHWGYSEELIALWEDDLTITPAFITGQIAFCAVLYGAIIGFYALRQMRGNQAESATEYTDFTDAGDLTQPCVRFVQSAPSVAGEHVYELVHMWIDPQHIGAGVGRLLFDHAVRTARSIGGSSLRIVSDPHAAGFYLRMGARCVGEVPSIPEGRMLPLLALEIHR